MTDTEFVRKILKLADRWWNMHRRVNNPDGSVTHSKIKVCEEWHGTKGRQAFVEWSLNNGFDFHLVLDRRENNGDYSPNNCQWITQKENVSKELRTIEYEGGFYTQTELVKKFAHPSVNLPCFKGRRMQGWPLEEALSRPKGNYRARHYG